ncbi:class I SAM-dependent methyltransferase [Devosia rhizoryzae]|uniref:Class I SAM-dependent methyltransferase n=1 Tax=Devosia rhizoryzae TaxID=2774137 RepID=A0ABX7CBV7_9HYPH|nr:class I SAM-dependent methyltransferase [Devosia rhizoryzae]
MLDVGCGTGSLSLLLAEAGHQVTGIDFSPAMIQRAIEKARDAELQVDFLVGDAARPTLPNVGVDVILGRHILWAISETPLNVVLERWAGCLRWRRSQRS